MAVRGSYLDWRALVYEPGVLLVGVGRLEYGRLVEGSAGNLQTNRQPLGCEAARDRYGRHACEIIRTGEAWHS